MNSFIIPVKRIQAQILKMWFYIKSFIVLEINNFSALKCIAL